MLYNPILFFLTMFFTVIGFYLLNFKKTNELLFHKENRHLFIITFKRVKPFFKKWIKEAFWRTGLTGSLFSSVLVMSVMNILFQIDAISKVQLLLWMVILSCSIIYMFLVVSLDVTRKYWTPWINQNPDEVKICEELAFQNKCFKEKKKFNFFLPKVPKSKNSAKKRI